MQKTAISRTVALSGLCALGGALCLAEQRSPSRAGSATPTAIAAAKKAHTPVNPQNIAATNKFGLRLFHQLGGKDTDANVFVSPISISLALGMACNGADGSTRAAMTKTLELPDSSLQQINEANAALQASLANPDPDIRLDIANSLWIHKGDAHVKPDFVARNHAFYGAEIGDLGSAPANVNAWVNAKTNGKIPTIVQQSDVARTIALLVNAVYFKGKWTVPFDPKATKNDTFTQQNGQKVPCKMMTQSGRYSYFQGENFQAVRLPYGKNRRMNLTVYLPNEGTNLNTLASHLTGENWELWQSKFHEAQGSIGLPRFRMEYEEELKETLAALGMGEAFDPARANFRALSDERTWISKVKHKTFVEVNEVGTEAAAATAIAMTRAAFVRPAPPFQMIMNRPFFCAIQDQQTGALLFLGLIRELK